MILNKAKKYVGQIFRKADAKENYYHNLTHTAEVVKITEEISTALNISDQEKEYIQLAAWFHDIGYTNCNDGHEEIGIKLAEEFLRKNNYPDGKIDKVTGLIRATKMPRNPQNLLEEIICDADLHHLGTEKFSIKEKLFRDEIEKKNGCKFKEKDWLKNNLDFMINHRFYTEYAEEKFGLQKKKNLNKIKLELKSLS